MNGSPVASALFDLAAWVALSCAAQGVPVKITDPVVLRRVCVLLGATESGPRLGRQPGRGPTRPVLEAPERPHPLGVQGPAAAHGLDHGVVQHRRDDGVSPAER